LTGVYNRHKLEESFEHELLRASRYKRTFSIILLDIDLFKAVNDTYGHQVGDDILIKVAELVQENIRSSDVLGRWGGEEFLIICPETDLTGAGTLADQVRHAIATYDFPVVGKKTASFGVACSNENESKESIIKRADDALYEAKNAGRDLVKLSYR